MKTNKKLRINLESWLSSEYERIEYRMQAMLGRRTLIIALMALVLGLTAADMAALGVMAQALEDALHMNNAAFGFITTIATLAGALATLPISILVDRWKRVPLMILLTLIWSVGMAWSGLIHTYQGLVLAQVVTGISGISLGAVIASLTGDYFPPSQRGRIFGLIVSGEMFGAGLGMVLTSVTMDFFSWRVAFWLLAVTGFVFAWVIWRYLREPTRGGMGAIAKDSICPEGQQGNKGRRIYALIEHGNIEPHMHRIIGADPTNWSWIQTARYILSIRTNVILLAGSVASYFYFAGLLTFAVLYLMERFELNTDAASMIFLATGSGGIIGVLMSGWLADWLLRRDVIAARVWTSAGAFFLAVVAFLPAFLLPELPVAAALFFFAALGLGATNAPLNAARLDIMHSRLWGRAEGLRNALRYIPVAFAPYIVGLISDLVDTGSRVQRQGIGLGLTFEFLLILLLVAGVMMFFAGLSYPRDVATAIASEHATAEVAKEQ
ncbi:MFS transporter [Acidihalobacter ferrooxydans]|nr:MFS transporter [Acidihalobacter ferrooxydans]